MPVVPMGGDGTDPATLTSANLTTGGEAIVFADVSSSTVTITLATADAREGNRVSVVDINSNAGTNPVTIDTEGGEGIGGSTSITLSTSGAAITLVSDGSTWVRESYYSPASGGGGGVTIEDDGAVVVDGATAFDAGTNLTASDDGDGTVTLNASGGSAASGITYKRNRLKVHPAAGPGINLTDQVWAGWDDPEGVEYHKGNLYLGTKGSDNTIYELDTNGTVVDSMTDTRFGHINTICWYSGEMWCGSATTTSPYDTTTLVVVDWETKTITDEIAFDGAAENAQLREMIPTSDGGMKMFATEYDFDDDAIAWGGIIDPDGFRADGTVAGHIDAVFDCDWQVNMQGAEYRNGHLYVTDHNHIARFRFPYADQIGDAFQLTGGLEWFQPSPNGLASLEQPAYNPDNGYWYVSANGGLYRGREANGTRRLGDWTPFSTAAGGPETSTVHSINSAAVSGPHDVALTNGEGYKALVEVWFYDDLSTGGDLALGAVNQNLKQMIGIQNSFTTSNYAVATETTTWTDAGISRPTSPQWVKFQFDTTNADRQFAVSKDYGETWESGPELQGGPSRTQALRIDPSSANGGEATGYVGTWTVRQTGGVPHAVSIRDAFPQIIDDFEGGTLDQSYIGDGTSSFSVQETTVYEGAYALQMDSGSSGGKKQMESYDSGTLSNYPNRGETFEGYVKFTSMDDLTDFRFGVQDTGDGTFAFYGLNLRPGVGDIRFAKNTDSTVTLSDATLDWTPYIGEWLRMEVQWGTIGNPTTGTVYDSTGTEIVSITMTDDELPNGGVSWFINSSSNSQVTAYFDEIKITG